MKTLSFDTYGIDTNILIYASDKKNIFYKKSRKIFEEIVKGKIKGVITPQNIFEYISVITSIKQIPKPISINTAIKDVDDFLNLGLNIIYPTQKSVRSALKFAEKARISGRKIFDFYLGATLVENDIRFLITANSSDFSAFNKYFRVINPFENN